MAVASESSTQAIDSGFASATQSTEPVFQRLPTTNGSEVNVNGKRTLPSDLATTGHNGKRPRPLALEDLLALRTIGTGGWGSVHTVRVQRDSSHRLERDDATFALKAVSKAGLRDMERNDETPDPGHAAERRNAERRHLSALPWSPFIAGLVDVYTDPKNIYLSLEYGPCGTLFSQMRIRALTDREIKFYFVNIILALEFLHTNNVVHCDVKPENLVVGADGYLLLTDFGLAQPLDGNNKWNRMGTLEYMSPEVLSDEPMDTVEKRAAADWWSAGICLYEMKTMNHPFTCDSMTELVDKHANAPILWPAGMRVDEGMKELVNRMLHNDLPHRYGASDVPEGKNGSRINRELRRNGYLQSASWSRIEKRVARAPRVADIVADEGDRRHRVPFVEQSKVPGLRLKRPSPRNEWIELKKEKELSPHKKRRLGGQLSTILPQLPRSPSMYVERGSIAA